MKTMTIEIPEGKRAEWVDGVLTLVDDKPVEFKFKVGDKVVLNSDKQIHTISAQTVLSNNRLAYDLEDGRGCYESDLIPYTPQDITERIKTFEDACEWCKENGKQGLYEQYADALNVGLQRSPDILAYLKLRIITAALNEGWEPTFNGEKRYVVAIDYKDEMSVTYECNFAMIPKKLVYKTYELAEYAATQFKDIYMDFCYKGKE